MTMITIALPEERLRQLKEVAAHLQVTPEELVQLSIEELLGRPEESFREAARYVMDKNAELYRRLA
jgi:antitoxin FitA